MSCAQTSDMSHSAGHLMWPVRLHRKQKNERPGTDRRTFTPAISSSYDNDSTVITCLSTILTSRVVDWRPTNPSDFDLSRTTFLTSANVLKAVLNTGPGIPDGTQCARKRTSALFGPTKRHRDPLTWRCFASTSFLFAAMFFSYNIQT